MRNISFALTTPQIRARTKTVTRRLGWRFLLPKTLPYPLMACKKCQGIKPGELVRITPIQVVKVNVESLYDITPYDVVREGFPNMSPDEFIEMFCKHMKVKPDREITRIEFEYVDGEGS